MWGGKQKTRPSYVAPWLDRWSLPIDIHCHGLDSHDVSSLQLRVLEDINTALEARGHRAIVTAYLQGDTLADFEHFMRRFSAQRRSLPNILGVALEGPLLARTGGIPEGSKWARPPNHSEWCRIGALGALGLTYVVFSPNADSAVGMAEITKVLLDNGIAPALGHFGKDADPGFTAKRIQQVLSVVSTHGCTRRAITDHLFNDMPVNISYAWRDPAARKRRRAELEAIDLKSLSFANLDARLGPVPATLIRGARDGMLTLCLNFDGRHVDPSVCQRVVEMVGARNILAMTDSAAVGGREQLIEHDGLLYAEKDGQRVVAASATGMDRQLRTLRDELGLEANVVHQITVANPARTLALPEPSQVRLIAVDVDGTLLNSKGQLAARTTSALRQAMEAGLQVVLATGRTRRAVAEILDRLELKLPGVFVQGTLVQDGDGSILTKHVLPPEASNRVIDFARSLGFDLVAFSQTEILTEALNQNTRRFMDYNEPAPKRVGSLRDISEGRGLLKLILLGDIEAIGRARPSLEACVGAQASVVQAVPGMLDILPRESSKGAGLATVLSRLGLVRGQAMAIGDAENDIELFANAGIGVAVANAEPRLLEKADLVVSSNDNDGVAEALDWLVMQKAHTAQQMRAPDGKIN